MKQSGWVNLPTVTDMLYMAWNSPKMGHVPLRVNLRIRARMFRWEPTSHFLQLLVYSKQLLVNNYRPASLNLLVLIYSLFVSTLII